MHAPALIPLLVACAEADAPENVADAPETVADAPETVADAPETVADAPETAADAPETVADAFPPPPGAVPVPPDAFGAWLAARTVAPADRAVRTHDGRVVPGRARVVEMPLVKGDLQQCADSAIRLRAEWLRERGEPVSFHATSGDPLPLARWEAGEKPVDLGGRIAWVPGGDGSWEGYLTRVFTWAGSRSLAYDTVSADEPLPGDLLVDPGSPGHVVVLMGVAEREGETLLLVGEGFMPAQDFHVEIGPEQGWWPWRDGLDLPHWRFDTSHVRRWK